jgi:zinc transport system ATP-binding protein
MDSKSSLIRAENVTLGYGRTTVLRDVTFDVKRSNFAALLGPNGAGKTTLLLALLGQIHPRQGLVVMEPNLRYGYVPQVDEQGSFWPLAVFDFVSLFSRGATAVEDVLARLGIADLAHLTMQQLSGGQRQKVLLAKALINEPDLLLLDEPTQGMDVASEADFLQLLKRLNRDGLSIVLVTHLLHVVLCAAQNVLIIHDGIGTPTTVDGLIRDSVLDQVYDRSFVSGMIGGTPVMMPGQVCEDA